MPITVPGLEQGSCMVYHARLAFPVGAGVTNLDAVSFARLDTRKPTQGFVEYRCTLADRFAEFSLTAIRRLLLRKKLIAVANKEKAKKKKKLKHSRVVRQACHDVRGLKTSIDHEQIPKQEHKAYPPTKSQPMSSCFPRNHGQFVDMGKERGRMKCRI